MLQRIGGEFLHLMNNCYASLFGAAIFKKDNNNLVFPLLASRELNLKNKKHKFINSMPAFQGLKLKK